ncbi:MAG: 50S ribosomal protein L11 methyltransferase [Flavobacteriales bacterium]|jgi:ribosomal protein L11 methyltransferase|nr:50S ribosomal protein L11 methyltransferase [Flavobacteriales bacterium]
MKYFEFLIDVETAYPGEVAIWSPIITAELAEIGFESFVEEGNVLKAYVQEENMDHNALEDLFCLQQKNYTFQEIENQNWNAEWEKNYTAINVDNQCVIRADFHPKQPVEFDILINPKMSFGTGHHETTHMMTSFVLETSCENKDILDMGCGTGVLAILAKMKNAAYVEAIDNDEWAFENSADNIRLNKQEITCKLGDASLLGNHSFDIILANINRNILLNDMPEYVKNLKENGLIFFSGFYTMDIEKIEAKANELGLQLLDQKERNDWVSLKFQKA